MENSNGSSNFKSYMYAGQQSLLPPRIPFPSAPPSSYFDYGSSSSTISKGSAKQRQGLNLQRTSSESFLMDEQPSWVEELLNEPETPVRKGHRRSSSDSFAYFNPANAFNMDSLVQADHELRNKASLPRRGSQDFDHYNNVSHASLYQEPNYFMRQKGATWESPMNSMAYSGGLRDNAIVPSSGFSCSPQEPAEVPSAPAEKQEQDNSWQHDPKVTGERRDFSSPKPSGSDTDPKRAKQQFAQRSRVRKLQYIAELERNVQALQVEGSGVAAEIEFLDQQNLILNMENKALKQRLDGLTQEQLIKCLEQEMLEREISRLRILYQQQQLQQQQPQQQQQRSSHRRSSSRDNLDSQFASLSLKHETGSGRDPVRI